MVNEIDFIEKNNTRELMEFFKRQKIIDVK